MFSKCKVQDILSRLNMYPEVNNYIKIVLSFHKVSNILKSKIYELYRMLGPFTPEKPNPKPIPGEKLIEKIPIV